MPVTDYKPGVVDVANMILQRTRDTFGNVTGTFSSTTEPTDTQVEALIDNATDKVSLKVGDDIPATLWEDAKDVVATRAAMLVETTFFAEQIQNNRSPYPILKVQFDEDIKDLQLAVQAAEQQGGTTGDQPYTRPRYSFPTPQTTWDQRF